MKTNTKIVKLWTCPKCGRPFERNVQSHSCRPFKLEQHFDGKPAGRRLNDQFKKAVAKQAGAFKIESLQCSIHLVSTFSSVAVKVFRNKISVEFALPYSIKSEHIKQSIQM